MLEPGPLTALLGGPQLLDLFPPELEIEVEEVTAVLHALQQFEPVAAAASNSTPGPAEQSPGNGGQLTVERSNQGDNS